MAGGRADELAPGILPPGQESPVLDKAIQTTPWDESEADGTSQLTVTPKCILPRSLCPRVAQQNGLETTSNAGRPAKSGYRLPCRFEMLSPNVVRGGRLTSTFTRHTSSTLIP